MAHPLTCAPGSRSPILADRSNPHLTSPLIVFPLSLFFSIPTGGNPVVSIKSRSSGAHNRRPPCGLRSNLDYPVRPNKEVNLWLTVTVTVGAHGGADLPFTRLTETESGSI
ncbi:hypothetical protein JCGZ_01570 [Jatropha curcas]|uniref:Uncharacterized protein n=1 Tax=Jatropha curcas TaxID=180498 RepID=A0A067LK46_JATCU|nr:hypothetical protein JCGZ_01570 [Jatropha curcas]